MSAVTFCEVNPGSKMQEEGLRDLEKAFRDCESRLGRPATNLEVCSELGLSIKELYSRLDRHKGIGLGRVEDCRDTEVDRDKEVRVRYFPDPENEESFLLFPKATFSAAMAVALDKLPKNEKLVITLHHNEGLSLQEVAEIFGVSSARIAQIHTTAMLRIRGKLQPVEPC